MFFFVNSCVLTSVHELMPTGKMPKLTYSWGNYNCILSSNCNNVHMDVKDMSMDSERRVVLSHKWAAYIEIENWSFLSLT